MTWEPRLIGCHAAPEPVLGVDGCPAGWVGALLIPRDPVAMVLVAPSISQLYAVAQGQLGGAAGLAVVAVDMPIGLPDVTLRRADRLARQKLKGKASSVFNVLSRDAYAAPDRAAADVINRARTGQGVSAQSFALRAKIQQVDQWVRSGPGVSVIECHPEVSFTELVGEPILASKRSSSGSAARVAALRGAGIDPPEAAPIGAKLDDVLDACVAAWTAARYAQRAAYSLPHPPERFSDDWPAAIWV